MPWLLRRLVQTDTRERDGHAGKAGMASSGIASDAGAARPDVGIASDASEQPEFDVNFGPMAVDVVRFKELLQEERRRVLDAIEYLHKENPGSIEEETEDETQDNLAETATATLDREIDYTLEENSEHVLGEIEGALARIEQGTYGTCVNCERPIAEERLAAIPWATYCIDCKRLQERI